MRDAGSLVSGIFAKAAAAHVALAASLLLGCFSTAQAALITVTQSQTFVHDSATDTTGRLRDTLLVPFDPFDTSLGVLNSVSISIVGTVSATASISFPDPGRQGAWLSSYSTHTARVVGGPATLFRQIPGIELLCAENRAGTYVGDTCINFAAIPPIQGAASISSSSDLDLYSGTEPWSILLLNNMSLGWVAPPPSVSDIAAGRKFEGDIQVSFAYEPHPQTVPTPAPLTLLLPALLLLVVRRHRNV